MPDHYADRDTPYRNEEWLREKYWGDELSTAEIGELCGVAQQTISQWLRNHDIERRSFGNLPKDLPYKNEGWLRQKYEEEGSSGSQIADECGVSLDVIQRWMRKFDIEPRSYGGYAKDAKFKQEGWLREKYENEGLTLNEMMDLTDLDSEVTLMRWMDHHGIDRREPNPGNQETLSPQAVEYLEGLLLGDGHLSLRKGSLSAVYEHGDSFREYIEWLSNELAKLGIQQSGKIRALTNGSYMYKSLSYRDLEPLHSRWYMDGVRQLPTGIELTPTRVKNWYVGDGKRRRGDVWFTLDFQTKDHSKDAFQSLRSDLIELGIENSVEDGRLYLDDGCLDRFYEYVLSDDSEIPPGYEHKFP